MNFNEYLKTCYKNKSSEWNPDEHEDWELPPIRLMENYLDEVFHKEFKEDEG